ncbi:MAG: hypothetical protein ICV51_10425 [Flavisolibacter sp.]|nr:hypothetical protein [Flavisolibacter sp.]
MKRLLASILLLLHINASMFFPVVEEQDIFNTQGVQQDDINSVAEYLMQDVLDCRPDQPTDEDDDQPDFFHLVKTENYVCFESLDLKITPLPLPKNKFHSFYNKQITAAVEEILTPPPDCLS